MLAVPYGGQPPAILDLRANRVQFNVSSIGLVTEHVVSGAVKALAVLGTARSPLLPNTPTVSEAGYPEINVVPWYGFAVPSGTPQPVVEKIAAGFQEVIKTVQVRELLQKQGLEPMQPMDLAELAKLYGEHTQKYANVTREAGIKRSD
jgi:tripartite-type tricarboxylate transporter receptor subunit TctC